MNEAYELVTRAIEANTRDMTTDIQLNYAASAIIDGNLGTAYDPLTRIVNECDNEAVVSLVTDAIDVIKGE